MPGGPVEQKSSSTTYVSWGGSQYEAANVARVTIAKIVLIVMI